MVSVVADITGKIGSEEEEDASPRTRSKRHVEGRWTSVVLCGLAPHRTTGLAPSVVYGIAKPAVSSMPSG